VEQLVIYLIQHEDFASRFASFVQAAATSALAYGKNAQDTIDHLKKVLLPEIAEHEQKETEELLKVFNKYFGQKEKN
jgi:peptidoglycan biosynthesis protein MviN/MurJ (putative lipid II flippase)